MERVSTGIAGLDEALEGGYPRGTNVLICGSAGTGKTVFCTQFLHAGVLRGEPGLFITLEERTSDLRDEMLSLGWDLTEHEKNGKLIIIDASSSRINLPSSEEFRMNGSFDIDSLILEIHRASTRVNARRLVLDSIPAMELKINDPSEFRATLFRLSSLLLELDITSLMTTETAEPFLISRYGIEEFVTRGVILLSLEADDSDLKRFLRVRKMRGTRHSLRNIPFDIVTREGIIMYMAK